MSELHPERDFSRGVERAALERLDELWAAGYHPRLGEHVDISTLSADERRQVKEIVTAAKERVKKAKAAQHLEAAVVTLEKDSLVTPAEAKRIRARIEKLER